MIVNELHELDLTYVQPGAARDTASARDSSKPEINKCCRIQHFGINTCEVVSRLRPSDPAMLVAIATKDEFIKSSEQICHTIARDTTSARA